MGCCDSSTHRESFSIFKMSLPRSEGIARVAKLWRGVWLPPKSWALFRSVCKPPNTCQLLSLDNDRDANRTATLLIPNLLLIREAALLGVKRREGREAEMLMRRWALTAHRWVFQ